MLQPRIRFAALTLAAIGLLPHSAPAQVVGEPAPPLTFTRLLGAPAGAHANWSSLRGKVVVLEFWATWCPGCVEEIPHLNGLVQSLRNAPVQFIAADDEDLDIVQRFLLRAPIKGWVGLDATGKTTDRYDAQVRPRTVIVDPHGRVAAILSPDQLTADNLLALADGKPVVFPKDESAELRTPASANAKTAPDAGGAWLDLSVRPGDPAAQPSYAHHFGKHDGSYTYDITNTALPRLLQLVSNIPATRVVIRGDTGHTYSLHLRAPGGDIGDLAPAVELSIAAAANMKLTHTLTEADAWVLETTSSTPRLMHTSTSNMLGSLCFYDKKAGKLVLLRSPMDSLAQTLEAQLGKPVVNETHLSGKFDASFDAPADNAAAISLALEKNLGLVLEKKRRSIERLVLDPMPAPNAPDEKPAHANQPTPQGDAASKPL